MTPALYKKICLLGDFAVGKTSMIRRYVDNQFSDEYLTTVGVKISRKIVDVKNSAGEQIAIQLIIWDLEGRSSFGDTATAYLQGASGAIIVGDLTRPDTLAKIEHHAQTFTTVNAKGTIIAACNKADLVAPSDLPPLPQFNGVARILETRLTSARRGDGINELFVTLASHLAG